MYKRSVILLITILPLIIISFSFSYGQEVPFTQDDRDRLIRIETKVEALEKRIGSVEQSVNQWMESVEQSMNQRIDDLRSDMRDLRTFMLLGFGILFGAMGD
ncbi:MAG: hypothetical protein JSW07_21480 [bacterium]|nr:MAG: hypothetical protein JSW07_21480 [bacterium]